MPVVVPGRGLMPTFSLLCSHSREVLVDGATDADDDPEIAPPVRKTKRKASVTADGAEGMPGHSELLPKILLIFQHLPS